MWNVGETYENLSRMNELETRLLQWRLAYGMRDTLVREASKAGLRCHRIAALSGLSRQTVGRIIEGDPRVKRQAPR